MAGCGGFINITQNANRLFFAVPLPAGGLDVKVEDGKLTILKEGRSKKFLNQVEQITFSGNYAQKVNQPVMYITERAVFRLTPKGMELTEIARESIWKRCAGSYGFCADCVANDETDG